MAAEARLRQVFADVFGVAPEAIDDDSSIDTIGGWSSMRHLNLVVALEECFDVRFSEQETLEILSYPLVKAVLAEHGVRFTAGEAGR